MHATLPDHWIASIFARLQVRYGSQWSNKWRGIELADVQADWARELAGYARNPDSIRHALDNLPADAPPTVGQFNALCRNAPVALPPALPAPAADPERVKACTASLVGKVKAHRREWAHELQAREPGGGLTEAQRTMWRAALHRA